MLKKIIEIDRYLFLKINKGLQSDFLDSVTLLFRESKFWVPLYLFMLLFLILNFGKKALGLILLAIVTFSATDFISSKIFKPFFGRPRPCVDSYFADQVRLIAGYCGGNGSFPSSHAANHFCIAMFFFVTLRHIAPKAIYLFFIWAAAVCFSQIYVGVHYPTDILGGTALGLSIGALSGKLYNKKMGLLH